MNVQPDEIQQRLGFIDRTIDHAVRACHSDSKVPDQLRDFVHQLGQQSTQAQRALLAQDASSIRQSVDDLARLSYQAQDTIRASDDTDYEVKSAVILTHIELSALRYQLD